MLRSIFRTALTGLRAGGLFGLAQRSAWRNDRLLILCYHGFSLADEHQWNPDLYVPGTHFEARIRRLRADGFCVLPLGEAFEKLHSGKLPPGSVAITVDDGLYDFRAVAYPILQRLGVPVTVYVTTYYVTHQRPAFDTACEYLLWKACQSGRPSLSLSGEAQVLALTGYRPWTCAAGALRSRARSEAWSADQKHGLLEHLAEAAGMNWRQFLEQRMFGLMSLPEIGALDPALVDVQLHTHRHRMPDQREAFLRELEENRGVLEAAGIPRDRLHHFCYPSGEYRSHHLPWLREAGITTATTCVPGLASRHSDPLLLPRFVDTFRTPAIEFDAWASGVRGILNRRTFGL